MASILLKIITEPEPDLVLLLNEQPIDEIEILHVDKQKNNVLVKITNDGDAAATDMQVFLYLEKNKNISIYSGYFMFTKDTKKFGEYDYFVYQLQKLTLEPQQHIDNDFKLVTKNDSASARFAVQFAYVKQQEPTIYSFSILIKEQD